VFSTRYVSHRTIAIRDEFDKSQLDKDQGFGYLWSTGRCPGILGSQPIIAGPVMLSGPTSSDVDQTRLHVIPVGLYLGTLGDGRFFQQPGVEPPAPSIRAVQASALFL
jgi:hypothetical protein